VTKEGLIFRVFGYTHPHEGYICDAEYASSKIFKSENPKAFRTDGKKVFYKFYEDEGWRFVEKNFPYHMIFYKPLNRNVVGVECCNIMRVRKPQLKLRRIMEQKPEDELMSALQKVLEGVLARSGLKLEDFGVFGSMLHGFYHPRFSDIDLVVYGKRNVRRLREFLVEMYREDASTLRNEFECGFSFIGKLWRFRNISPEEFVWHQGRKMIYGVLYDKDLKREIKVEFEPVKDWSEIQNEYSEIRSITSCGWVKAYLQVKDDEEVPFMPSIYGVETLNVVEGPKIEEIRRVVSYIEEFRMQAWKGENVYVEGNLEKVETSKRNFYQVTLTYCPRYYDQVLKIVR
jgi:predicted nucleotidyltransferase